MPGYDGTGPEGRGPFGRGLGPCGSGEARGRRGFFGFRRGFRAGGRGSWWPFHQLYNDEKIGLESEKNWLSKQLDAVNERLNDLNKE